MVRHHEVRLRELNAISYPSYLQPDPISTSQSNLPPYNSAYIANHFHTGETIPIRLFLGGFDLTPTFREVNKKYSTRYYLSLVLIDEGKSYIYRQAQLQHLNPPPLSSPILMARDRPHSIHVSIQAHVHLHMQTSVAVQDLIYPTTLHHQ